MKKKLKFETIINFTKQLSALLKAGIPLFKAIQIIKTQVKSGPYQEILENINQELAEGKSLASALNKYPASFSSFIINMIEVGESHGDLDAALTRIYNYLVTYRENRQKIINSLTYPLLLITSSFLVLIMLLVFVMPKFVEIFSQSEIDLPAPTKILFFINTALQHYYWLALIILAGLLIAYLLLHNIPKTKIILDRYKFKIPIVGNLLLTIYLSRFCRTFGILYKSGLQLLESLQISKPTSNNIALHREIDQIILNVQNGESLSKPLSESRIFPPMMAQMITVGEQTGSLDNLLLDIANFYEQDVEHQIKKYLALIEPLSLIIISGLVAFIAAAIMLPLFKMASAIHTF